MLDVCLLGTGGTMPLPNRFLTSLLTRINGDMLLIDCGEGTQVSIKMLGWGFKYINVICITHFHADHISGLPGILLAIANSDRREPLVIMGPAGIKRVVESLRVIVPELPYQIEYYEVNGVMSFPGFTVSALPVEHRSVCYAYKLEVARQGKFDHERAKALNLPVKYWSYLQRGETVAYQGNEIVPDMVMGPPRKGLKLCYATDLRPSKKLTEFIRDSDLYVGEGVYGDDDKSQKAKDYKHTLISETCRIAKSANVKELWLTHFSPSMSDPHAYGKLAKSIFQNAVIGRDRMVKTLRFE